MFNVNTYDLPKSGLSIIIYAAWLMHVWSWLMIHEGRCMDWLSSDPKIPDDKS